MKRTTLLSRSGSSLAAVAMLFASAEARAENRVDPEPTGAAPTPVVQIIEIQPAKPDAPSPALGSRRPTFDAGLRTMLLTSRGFDPYASDDILPSVSVGVGVPLLFRKGLSFGVHAEYDFGARADRARGLSSELDVHRIAFGLEPHARINPRLDAFLRLDGAAFHLRGSIDVAGSQNALAMRAWTYGLEAAGGASLELTSPADPGWARVWFVTQLGYAFSKETQMLYAPNGASAEAHRGGVVELPAFKPQGLATRVSFAFAF